MTLFPDLRPVAPPPPPAGVDLRCCPCQEIVADSSDAKLIIADPPWSYSQSAGAADPSLQYGVLSMSDIVAILASFHGPNRRLALWMTWPQIGEWMRLTQGWVWGDVKSGGSWHKSGPGGVGYHWLGFSEPVLLYVSGSPGCGKWDNLKNSHDSPREGHSVKPVDWMRGWIRRWTDPRDLVVEPFAGRGSGACATAAENRRYLGAEIDPDRHAQALTALARYLEAQ